MFRRALVAVASAAFGFAAPAQEPTQEKEPPAPAPPAEKAVSGEATEEIVVTGSRVRRKDLTTPAPVVVIDREQIQNSGYVSIGEFLQLMPEQANAMNRNWNNNGDGSTRLNLRGLGSHRTLVLLNGRRLGAGGNGADASSDVGSLPLAAVDRIEVLKDGASPMYGSDAIGGVVNVITRKSWSGAEGTAYSGLSSRGDGATYQATLTTGRRSDNGSLLLSAGYTRQDSIWSGRRTFSTETWAFDGTGLNSPTGLVGPYAIGSGMTPAGRVFTVAGAGVTLPNPNNDPKITFYNDLVTRYPKAKSFVPDPSAPMRWRPWAGAALPAYGGDQYNYAPANYLVTPAQAISLFATGDAQLTGTARALFEASYASRESRQKLAPEPFDSVLDGIVVSGTNAYNPFGVDLGNVRRRFMEAGNRIFSQSVETFRVLGGLDGTLPDTIGPFRGWIWEVSVGQGRTRATDVKSGYTRISALRDALGPSYQDAQRTWRCGPDAAHAITGCVPLNLFGGPGTIDASQVAAFTYDGTSRGTNATSDVLASLTGSLFPLFADRPVGLALGYEYRDVSGTLVPDPVTVAHDASTDGGLLSTNGSQDVHEAYAEFSIPIVSGVPLAENVEALAAARLFRYSGFPADWTWKLGGRWSVVRDVTLRGTWSTAFRAPSITELDYGAYQTVATVSDPCAGVDDTGKRTPVSPWCGAAANNEQGSPSFAYTYKGNSTLRPETARVVTAGIVLEPRFVKNLSLTVDAYDIRIENTIHSPNGLQLQACYPMSAAVQPSLCEFIQRDPATQALSGLIDTPLNLGTERMRGVDFALRYALPTPIGRFGAFLDATWLDRYDIVRADGSVLHVKGTQDAMFLDGTQLSSLYPSWRYNAGVTWGWRGFAAGASVRFVGGYHECGDISGLVGVSYCSIDDTFVRRVRPSDTWDAFSSYAFASGAGRTTVSVGVQNIFDSAPPRVYSAFFPSDPGYDFVGRFFYARLSHRL